MSSLYNHVNIVDTLQTEHYINQFEFFPLNLFPDAKRLIGRKFDDLVVQSDMKHWPFKVINESSKPKVEVEYKGEIKTFYAEEISSMVLTKMKEISEAYLGKVDKSEWITGSLKLGGKVGFYAGKKPCNYQQTKLANLSKYEYFSKI